MANISRAVIDHVVTSLSSSSGVNAILAELRKGDSETPAELQSFSGRNVAPELLEKSNLAVYPSLLVYCEKVSNTLQEKFRTFSGTARVTIELRHSEDRLECLERSTSIYTHAVCSHLEAIRGPWTESLMFWGGYEVTYSPIKAGGRHFVQSTKITFDVDVSE